MGTCSLHDGIRHVITTNINIKRENNYSNKSHPINGWDVDLHRPGTCGFFPKHRTISRTGLSMKQVCHLGSELQVYNLYLKI